MSRLSVFQSTKISSNTFTFTCIWTERTHPPTSTWRPVFHVHSLNPCSTQVVDNTARFVNLGRLKPGVVKLAVGFLSAVILIENIMFACFMETKADSSRPLPMVNSEYYSSSCMISLHSWNQNWIFRWIEMDLSWFSTNKDGSSPGIIPSSYSFPVDRLGHQWS